MTTDVNRKLKDNYNIIYNNLQKLGQGLEDYQKNSKGTVQDQLFLRDITVNFQDIIKTMVSEYAYKYPECEYQDSNGEILISDTIICLNKQGHINNKTANMLQQANYYGNFGKKGGELHTSDFLDIKDTYDDLINYLPEFVELFPHPNLKATQAKQQQKAQQIKTSNDTAQTTNSTDTAQKNIDAKRNSYTKASKNMSWVVAFLIIFIIFAIAYRYRTDSVENTNNQDEYEEGIEGIDNQSNIESERTQEDNGDLEGIEAAGRDGGQTNNEEKQYTIGETWTVEGQWEFTVDKVTSAPYEYDEGAQVITIDYHYTNIGYESGNGLYMPISSYASMNGGTQLIDADGIVCRSLDFPLVDNDINPEYATIGATWAARESFEAYSNNNSATLIYKGMDSNGETQTAVFDLNW